MDHRPHTDRTTPPSEEELAYARRHVNEMVRAGAIYRDDAAIRLGSLEMWAEHGRMPGDWELTDLCLWGAFRPLPREAVVFVHGGDDDDDGGPVEVPPPNVDYRALLARFPRRCARSRRRGPRSRSRCTLGQPPRKRAARVTR